MAAEDLKRATISLDPVIYATARRNAVRRGFKRSFSAYVEWLLKRDEPGEGGQRVVRYDPNDSPPVQLAAESPPDPAAARRKRAGEK